MTKQPLARSLVSPADLPVHHTAPRSPWPKTGVLTFHRCFNYGSYWQARSLVEGLRARGHAAELLDHRSPRASRAEWRCVLQPALPASTPVRDRILYAVKALRFLAAFATLPRSRPFPLEQSPQQPQQLPPQLPPQLPHYQTLVVGSDEVWSQRHPWFSGCGLFYGDGLRAGRLVSYAASFGSQSVWEGLDAEWAERLCRFAFISVRDENSWWMIRHFLGVEPDLVLDPCLQFHVRLEGPWRGPLGPREPFAAVYGHSFTPTFAQRARRWAHARGLPLVSIGYRNAWADVQWLTAGPRDFAHAMARAGAVVTNFFHGCVFALRNARPFVCETSSYRSIKVQDLMAAVGGRRHLVTQQTTPAAFNACLDDPLDSEILHRIEQLRRTSDAFLDRALALPEVERLSAVSAPVSRTVPGLQAA